MLRRIAFCVAIVMAALGLSGVLAMRILVPAPVPRGAT